MLYAVTEEDGSLLWYMAKIGELDVELPVIVQTEDEAREAMYAAHVQGKRPMTVQKLDWMMEEK